MTDNENKPESAFPDYKVPPKYRPLLAKIAKALTILAAGGGATLVIQALLDNGAA